MYSLSCNAVAVQWSAGHRAQHTVKVALHPTLTKNVRQPKQQTTCSKLVVRSSLTASAETGPVKTGGDWVAFTCMAATFVLMCLWFLSLVLKVWTFIQATASSSSKQPLVDVLTSSNMGPPLVVWFGILTVIRFWDLIQEWLSLPDQVSQLTKEMETKLQLVSKESRLKQELRTRFEHLETRVSDLKHKVKGTTSKDAASDWRLERWRQRKLRLQNRQRRPLR